MSARSASPDPAGFPRLAAVRFLTARPRLVCCTILAIIITLLLPAQWRWITRALTGWDMSVLAYFALISKAIITDDHEDIRQRAQALDGGRYTVLTLTVITAAIALGAIMAELGPVKNMTGYERMAHILLSAGTIALSWFFTHLIFALHYAHEYYLERDARAPETDDLSQNAESIPDSLGGLSFPGNPAPAYVEFIYFSYVIGIAAQTSDVSICSRPMRILVLVHSILSFFFNTTILALSINLVAGML